MEVKNIWREEQETDIVNSESDLPWVKHILFVRRQIAQTMKLLVPLDDAVLVDSVNRHLSGEISDDGRPSQRAQGQFGTLPANLDGQFPDIGNGSVRW